MMTLISLQWNHFVMHSFIICEQILGSFIFIREENSTVGKFHVVHAIFVLQSSQSSSTDTFFSICVVLDVLTFLDSTTSDITHFDRIGGTSIYVGNAMLHTQCTHTSKISYSSKQIDVLDYKLFCLLFRLQPE